MKTEAFWDGTYVTYPVGVPESEIKQIYEDIKKESINSLKKTLIELHFEIDENGDFDIKTRFDTIQRLRRITGYLSNENNFNDAKRDEAKARYQHLNVPSQWTVPETTMPTNHGHLTLIDGGKSYPPEQKETGISLGIHTKEDK